MKEYLQIRKKWALCVLNLWICCAAYSQDPLFSQYYAQPMHINPGFAGISYAPRFEMIYRNQWPLLSSTGSSYVTYSISYDQFFKKYNSGIGIQLLVDDAGAGLIKSYKIAGTYGYQAQISGDNYLRGGIELGFVQIAYDWGSFIFKDQIDPEFGPYTPGGLPNPSKEARPEIINPTYLDIGTGLLYYNPYFNVGISAKHINTPQNDILKINGSSYSGLPIRWVLHGGFQWDFSRSARVKSVLSPAIMIASQSEFFQLNVGAQYQISTVFAGVWYRQTRKNPDALIGVIGFKKGVWKVGYSFDFTLSELGVAQGGSHELSLGIFLDEIIKQKTNIQDCFQAFR